MKVAEKNKPIIFFIIFFPVLSWIFLFIGFFVALTFEQGLAGGGPYLSGILMTIANWPSLLLNIYPTYTDMHGIVGYDIQRGLFHPLVIIANVIGWGLFGFIVGLIISVIKERKQRQAKKEVGSKE